MWLKPIHKPSFPEEQEYKARREAVRNNIERYFEVRKSHFRVLRVENKIWYLDRIIEQVQACIILHITLVELQLSEKMNTEADEYGTCGTIAFRLYSTLQTK